MINLEDIWNMHFVNYFLIEFDRSKFIVDQNIIYSQQIFSAFWCLWLAPLDWIKDWLISMLKNTVNDTCTQLLIVASENKHQRNLDKKSVFFIKMKSFKKRGKI